MFRSVVTTDATSGYEHDVYIGVGGFVITDSNAYPEATLRCIDHFFSDEGTKQYFMGVEGVTYEQSADGSVEYSDLIHNNPDGLSYTDTISKNLTWRRGVTYPGVIKEAYFKGSEGLPTSIAAEKFQDNIPEEVWSIFNYNEGESEILSSIGVDIQDCITEMNALYITDEKAFGDWDKYVETLEKMGLDRFMEAHQSA